VSVRENARPAGVNPGPVVIVPARRRIVVESPLAGDVAENLRYLVWCCRALYLAGYEPLALHLGCPWFMDDVVPQERADGIAWSWFWQGDEHVFFCDRGMSRGMTFAMERCQGDGIRMTFAMERCQGDGIRTSSRSLAEFSAEWSGYHGGGWPPSTFGGMSFVTRNGGAS